MSLESVTAKLGVRGICLRAGLLLGIMLFLGTSLVLPQPATKDKAPVKPTDPKTDPIKKTKELPKTVKEPTPSTPKPGQEGPLDPPVIMSGKANREREDYIKQLEKKVKPERKTPTGCKLIGDLRDNTVVLEAAFDFKTESPNMIVPLGLQGGFLVDPKGLDQQALADRDLALKVDDNGFYLDVARPGRYQVSLHLKVPVRLPRSGDAASGDRGFSLGLPGAAFTHLSLGMPDKIREILWNTLNSEKIRQDGRWQIAPGASKLLEVTWKEPITFPGEGPLIVVKNRINVKLEETTSLITANMQLEDKRGQTREWHLYLPFHADIKEVVVPPGVGYKLVSPPAESRNQPFIIRLDEPNNAKFNVIVEVRSARKDANSLLVGPFFVQNAFQQQGTILVQAAPAAVRGQRLIYVTNEGTNRSEIRDLPKDLAGPDVLASFDYWSVPGQTKSKGPFDARIPLRIDWKLDKGSMETSVDHQLKVRLRPGGKMVQIDLTTTIKIKSSAESYLDVQFPRPPLPSLGLLGWMPAVPFPAAMPWGGLVELLPREVPLAEPMDRFGLEDESSSLEPFAIDSQGKAQIRFAPVNKEFTLTLVGRYSVPADTQHFRIELPRPLGSVDRGGKVSVVAADNQIELLMGSSKVDFKTDWDSSFTYLDVFWRPYRPQFVVQNVTDATIRGKEAHLREELTFSWSPTPGKEPVPRTGTVLLQLPGKIRNLKVISGGEQISPQTDPGRVKLTGSDKPLIVEFYQPLPEAVGKGWNVPLVTPEGTTQIEAKVRVWSDPGVRPEALDLGDPWQDRGSELVQERQAVPALVLYGSGKSLELTLRFPTAMSSPLPALVCDKGLIQAVVDEEGNHRYQASYLIQKLYANPLIVEFPAPVGACIPKISINNFALTWTPDPEDRNIAHVQIDPRVRQPLSRGNPGGMMLTIDYKVPANFAEGRSGWQTQLSGPRFRGDVFLGRVRWLVSLPPNWVSVVAGGNVHLDFRWAWQNWLLTPEPTIPEGELEAWPQAGRDEPSLVFTRMSQDPFVIVHLPRQHWLLLCSGLLLTVGLALQILPLSRTLLGTILVALSVGTIVAGFLWPAWGPALMFGAEPGALVLGLSLAIHWVVKERYRRQVIFMPGFTRLKPGSSLLQASSRPREASTVDAPAPPDIQGRGSSVAPQAPPG